MSVFIVFASRRGDFEEMMDVRGVIGELGLTPALSKRRGRKISSVINSLNIWHPSLSPFGESRSGALKARSATSSTGVFYVFFYTHIENYTHETNNAIRTSTYYLYPCRGSSVRIDP